MIVIILENVKPALRGELSRWLFEIKSGVFTGRVSALVREELWNLIERKIGKGSAVMIYAQNTEQGFGAKIFGVPSRTLEDIDGVILVKTQS
ncbi:type I-E CRISPR-associated endoribonuclease Cas2e [Parathermosynechococcus lividus]|nr:type I-E CRISPR-associated endoribonuclease Cas2e [Synechococcus sp. PCC 6716]